MTLQYLQSSLKTRVQNESNRNIYVATSMKLDFIKDVINIFVCVRGRAWFESCEARVYRMK